MTDNPLNTPDQREKERERIFQPYAIDLGWCVYEWNRLQASFADLFALAVGNDRVGFAIWHAVKSDLTQRDMLMAASEQSYKDKDPPRAFDDIKWLIDRTSKLINPRNDAIHAPLVFVNESLGNISLMPLYFLGSPRAKNLADKDLLKEIAWCRAYTHLLAEFAENLMFSIKFYPALKPEERPAWPDRPPLPQYDSSKS
jgi:hypothetical protein